MRDKGAAVGRPGATGSAAASSEGIGSLDHLWLLCQHRLVAHIAHDLKGALNGVSVNLEVVRGRAGRPDTPASDLLQYANAARDQLEVVIHTTTALLSIGRAVRGVAEVSVIARQIVALLEDTLKSDGATIELAIDGGLAGTTSAPPSAVRLALAEMLFSQVVQKRNVAVRIKATAAPTVEIRSEGSFEMLPDIGRALADAGIQIKTDGHGISIVFPGPTEPPTEDA